MKLLVFSNILALGLVSCSSLYDFGKVHPLAVPNIAEVLKDFPVSMVKFYTPSKLFVLNNCTSTRLLFLF